jgi:hypothetical protein
MNQYYTSNTRANVQLPPGKYVYSPQLQTTLNQTTPTYWVTMEPIFFDHLMLHLNKKVRIVTVTEALEGTITGVAIDHVQLTIDDIDYHIRFEHIIYFRKI